MRKLALDLDALVVESFATAEETRQVGTVKGNQESGALGVQFSCNPDACGGGGESAETACGPCPDTGNTKCGQYTCRTGYTLCNQHSCGVECSATCYGPTDPCKCNF